MSSRLDNLERGQRAASSARAAGLARVHKRLAVAERSFTLAMRATSAAIEDLDARIECIEVLGGPRRSVGRSRRRTRAPPRAPSPVVIVERRRSGAHLPGWTGTPRPHQPRRGPSQSPGPHSLATSPAVSASDITPPPGTPAPGEPEGRPRGPPSPAPPTAAEQEISQLWEAVGSIAEAMRRIREQCDAIDARSSRPSFVH